jgi:hypothetical protein
MRGAMPLASKHGPGRAISALRSADARSRRRPSARAVRVAQQWTEACRVIAPDDVDQRRGRHPFSARVW